MKEIDMFTDGDKVVFKGNPESPIFVAVYMNTNSRTWNLERADDESFSTIEYVPEYLLEKASEPFKVVPGRFYKDKENDLWVGREDGKLVYLPDNYLNEPEVSDEKEYGPFVEYTEFTLS